MSWNSVPRLFCLGLLSFCFSMTSAVAQQESSVTLTKVKEGLPYLEKAAEDIIHQGGVPGMSIAVVYKDEVVYLKGFGVREAGKSEPVDADTVFQIASLSKPISSNVVSALVGERLISWDTRIAQIAPDLQMYDPYVTREITIRDLFCHRSGMLGTAGDDLEAMGYDQGQCLYRQRFLHPSSSFRTQYSYSNLGLTTGAVAAARPTGKPWEVVAEERLFQPLGMKATSYRYADFIKHKNRARLHVRGDERWVAKFERQPDVQAPAGGVSSTARDLSRWLLLNLNEGKVDRMRIIPADTLALSYVPQITRPTNPISGSSSFYALGWSVEHDPTGHSFVQHAGAFSVGARTNAKLLPSERLGIVVLTNAFPTGVPDGLCDAFFDQVLNGKQSRDWVGLWTKGYAALFAGAEERAKVYVKPLPNPAPALSATAYVGIYDNDYFGPVEVRETGGALTFVVGPKKRTYTLRHWNRDTFLITPDEELPTVHTAISFVIGPDGKAEKFIAEHLNDYGQGTFAKKP